MGGREGKRPHNILLGGATPPHKANGTTILSIIHVDMIFCVKGTGRDSKGWPTIEYALIDTTVLRAK